ncbi:acyl-CoA dehydrogenase [Paroceanicella profunda]|uniref:3-methylmercaptopropionyl-CoA dehydrogenase n=1 Tax=Paroceanicella profunda TaxID=2579971 RepID=A0A5B8FHR0_9RHOB|nr:acyl-CoA dehydrogenase [Paroceanicella profunda]QDL92258.1 acyl-CoA dehydrogenase [Paroceanicella profunda]
MQTYAPPLRDFAFLLHEVLRAGESPVPALRALDPETTAAVLAEAGRIATEVLAPLNASGDRAGCRLENGGVRTPQGFAEAYALLRDDGWNALDCAQEWGGQGQPHLLGAAVGEMHVSANMALMMYPGLTHGAYSTIRAHGTEAQKRIYLPPLTSGRWTGTMNLTEPQCGTDLGLMRSRAEPQADGSYRITGQKIFISSGEHDLTENIVHLVLARIPGGPEGIRGVSLFIVPKFLPDAAGAPGPRNALSCSKLEKKMGIHANATCVMDYDGATGFLLGEEHKGMRAMFTMMNEARIKVGLQGLAQAAAAHQAAVTWARERLQGRAVIGPSDPAQPADPILRHPDIRRILMEQRAFVEGGRAFLLSTAALVDAVEHSGDPEAAGRLALLTPVVKAFLTDRGFEACVNAQQVFGGHGYIEETGIAQFLRDARVAMIYEGTNGVQALDLVGRKLPADTGQHIAGYLRETGEFLSACAADGSLPAEFLGPLAAGAADLGEGVAWLASEGPADPAGALAGATDFLHLFGLVCLGRAWADMARVAAAALAGTPEDPAFYEAKLATGRFYMARILPETALRLIRIRTGAGPVTGLAESAY